MEILEWSACRNKSGPSPLLNVAVYWQHPSFCQETVSDTYKQHHIGNTQVCAKILSQILANNIDNGGEGNWSQNLCEVLLIFSFNLFFIKRTF